MMKSAVVGFVRSDGFVEAQAHPLRLAALLCPERVEEVLLSAATHGSITPGDKAARQAARAGASPPLLSTTAPSGNQADVQAAYQAYDERLQNAWRR